MNSMSDYFPQYNKLTRFEKLVLKTCCYLPPKPRRQRGVDVEMNVNKYERLFLNAYHMKDFSSLNNKRILDFGCGEGGFSVALAINLANSEVVGIDLLEGQMAASKFKKENGIKNLHFIVSRSEQLEDQSFDCVFSHDSFEHFEDPEYILSEIIRLTKKDGMVMIKFGPTWCSPYGRHMGGTFRKDRPWIHLLIPEKHMMRVHSVYHNRHKLFEHYKDLEGGLNKMTVKRANAIIKKFNNVEVVESKVSYLFKGSAFKNVPVINEMLSSSLYIKLKKSQ
ncbi:class I SAM-dependent methyltransferase [Subsaxibacter sp. CAU 1640]|uniref:class I SAM-dependent methyltransferase n=1 Tax=Subsaxibacter sp. CAU 1640 TaxID=2933271 RepID=UPI002002B7A1|nr:class I SAM-dependent methyltransferase [Subsaxibacter sp. CAU 1640]MCK7589894.1 class I SAM-dependent methyltransferase [Subsaxibacter sp. CAU 1640]